jgi:hypothetical protein
MKMIAGEKRIIPIVPVCGPKDRRNRIVSRFLDGKRVELFRPGPTGFIPVPKTELIKGLRNVKVYTKGKDGHITILTGEDVLGKNRNGDVFFKMKTQDKNVIQSFVIGSLPQPTTRDELINEFFGKLYVNLDEHAGKQEKHKCTVA